MDAASGDDRVAPSLSSFELRVRPLRPRDPVRHRHRAVLGECRRDTVTNGGEDLRPQPAREIRRGGRLGRLLDVGSGWQRRADALLVLELADPALLKHVVQATGARGLFYDTRDLLRVIRSTYDPAIRTTELDILRPVMTAELLVLDDLGAEKTSEWVDETMNLIVNTRYNERRLTIFTSNYPDIPDDTDPQSLLFRIGARMRSRLHEMCEFVVLDAADYRERPDNASADDLMAMWKMRSKSTSLPSPRAGRQARAQLKDGKGDLKWSGGRAGS